MRLPQKSIKAVMRVKVKEEAQKETFERIAQSVYNWVGFS